jgi:hypothetical protein
MVHFVQLSPFSPPSPHFVSAATAAAAATASATASAKKVTERRPGLIFSKVRRPTPPPDAPDLRGEEEEPRRRLQSVKLDFAKFDSFNRVCGGRGNI